MESTSRPPRAAARSAYWAGLGALLLYTAVAVGILREVLVAPSALLPIAEAHATPAALEVQVQDDRRPAWVRALASAGPGLKLLVQADQRLTVANLAHHARALPFAPQHVWTGPQCYPTPRATALGEHMIALGLVGWLPWQLLGDPVAAYNWTLVLYLVLSGLCAYFVVFRTTGSALAALVAGLLLEVQPWRTIETAHIYAVANHWIPLALYFSVRLLSEQRWRHALLATLFIALTLAESVYPMLGLAALGLGFGLYYLVVYRHTLRQVVPQMAVGALLLAGVTWLVLHPYLDAIGVWNAMGDRTPSMLELADLTPGSFKFPGLVLSGLALWGAVDWIRHRRHLPRHDLRPGIVVGSLLLCWWVARAIPVPLVGLEIPSLLALLSDVVPTLRVVRAPEACIAVLYPALALLAGYGIRSLLEARSTRVAAGLAVLLAALGLFEVSHPSATRLVYGTSTRVLAEPAPRPGPEEQALFAQLAPGPVLDLPMYSWSDLRLITHSHALLSGAFHGHPVGACYNSYIVEVQHDVARLAARMQDDPAAVEALRALGFRNVLYDRTKLYGAKARGSSEAPSLAPPAVHVAQAADLTLYHLAGDAPVIHSFEALAVREQQPEERSAPAGEASLEVRFHNSSEQSYRHPDPLRPSDLVVRWFDAADREVKSSRTRALLPLALAPGASDVRELVLQAPDLPGDYRLELAHAEAPERVLARLRVQVKSP